MHEVDRRKGSACRVENSASGKKADNSFLAWRGLAGLVEDMGPHSQGVILYGCAVWVAGYRPAGRAELVVHGAVVQVRVQRRSQEKSCRFVGQSQGTWHLMVKSVAREGWAVLWVSRQNSSVHQHGRMDLQSEWEVPSQVDASPAVADSTWPFAWATPVR